MLRDDLEVALNDLILALQETAEAYATAAELEQAPERAGVFGKAVTDHRRAAQSLQAAQRSLGYLPKEPDSERSLLRDALLRVKAQIAGDETAALIEERRRDEARIAEAAEALLAQKPAEDLAETVRRISEDAKTRDRELDAMARDAATD